MSFIVRGRKVWPYATNSTGRLRGSLSIGPLSIPVLVFEAIGEAREIFAQKLSGLIIDYLHENIEQESASPIDLSLFMMGRSSDRTKPVVMLVSSDKAARVEAYRAIKDSDILKDFPGFDVGHMDLRAEYENFQPLGGGSISEMNGSGTIHLRPRFESGSRGEKSGNANILVTLGDNSMEIEDRIEEVFGAGISCIGMRLLVVRPPGATTANTIHQAIGGGVVSYAGSYYLLTVNHFLDRRADGWQPSTLLSTSAPIHSEHTDCEVAYLSDFEDDEDVNPDIITSRGSRTPDSTHSETSDTGNEGSSSTISHGSVRPELLDQADNAIISLGISDEPAERSSGHPQRPLGDRHGGLPVMRKIGNVVVSSYETDFCLIRIDHPDSQSLTDAVPLENYGSHVETSASDAPIETTISGTHRAGFLSGTPSFVRLPRSRTFRQVYICKFHQPPVPGDCGAWVRHSVSGRILGHVVAGSPMTGLAWIMPAQEVFAQARSYLQALGTASSTPRPKSLETSDIWTAQEQERVKVLKKLPKRPRFAHKSRNDFSGSSSPRVSVHAEDKKRLDVEPVEVYGDQPVKAQPRGRNKGESCRLPCRCLPC